MERVKTDATYICSCGYAAPAEVTIFKPKKGSYLIGLLNDWIIYGQMYKSAKKHGLEVHHAVVRGGRIGYFLRRRKLKKDFVSKLRVVKGPNGPMLQYGDTPEEHKKMVEALYSAKQKKEIAETWRKEQ